MEIQLELNIHNHSSSEVQLAMMQKQLDLMSESMGKMRRKLFAEMGELKKLCHDLKEQNQELKRQLSGNSGKVEWLYIQGDSLFEAREA